MRHIVIAVVGTPILTALLLGAVLAWSDGSPAMGSPAQLVVATDTPTPTDTPTDTPTPADTPTPTPTSTYAPPTWVPTALIIEGMTITLQTGGSCAFTSTMLGVEVYVKNTGTTAAGPFVVDVNGSQQSVPDLGAGQTLTLWFSGYLYSGSQTATIYINNQVARQLTQFLPVPTLPPTCTPTATSTPTATPTSTPTPITLSSCPPRISGQYVGTTDSGMYARPLAVDVVFDGVNIVGDPPGQVSGFVDCGRIYISYEPPGEWYGASLIGDLSADGVSFSGEYSFSSGGASGYGVFEVALVGANLDTDHDGFADPLEVALRKHPDAYCSIMRADVDYDGVVSILDLSKAAQSFGQAVPPAPSRSDQDGDGVITILDLSRQARVFGEPVTSCP